MTNQENEGFDLKGKSPVKAPAPSPDPKPAKQAEKPVSAKPEQSAKPVKKQPLSFKDALQAVKDAEALPAKTKEEARKREKAVQSARTEFARMQQGVPVASFSPKDFAVVRKNQLANAKASRLAALASRHPEVRELIAERDQLKSQLETKTETKTKS